MPQFIQIVVPDADAALAYLQERGVEATGVEEQPWGRFVNFSDPDGNRWALQQIVRPSRSTPRRRDVGQHLLSRR